jgi:membrane protein YdbS with pleckstrin-like domain
MKMPTTPEIKLDEEFRPAPQLRTLYFIYLLLGILIGVLPWCVPLVLSIPRVSDNAPFIILFFLVLPLLAFLGFIACWIPRYYGTIRYKLTNDEVVWQRGVWFRQTGIVPYNRITNIDTIQGPISRMLGIAALRIQTAGYSGQQTRAEIGMNGIEHFDALRALLMSFIRGKKPAAVETYESEEKEAATRTGEIHRELVRIRELLEQVLRK